MSQGASAVEPFLKAVGSSPVDTITYLETHALFPIALLVFMVLVLIALFPKSPMSARARRLLHLSRGNKKQDDGSHSWCNAQQANVVSAECCVCHEVIGLDQALECDECIYVCHEYCSSKATLNCKAWAADSTSTSFRLATSNEVDEVTGGMTPFSRRVTTTAMVHQFQEGNLGVGTLCAVCHENCGSLVGLGGLKCLWCSRAIHKECEGDLPSAICDLGRHGKLVLSPCEIQRIQPLQPLHRSASINKLKKSVSNNALAQQQRAAAPGASAAERIKRRAGDMKDNMSKRAKNAYLRMRQQETPLDLSNYVFQPLASTTPLLVFVNRKSGGNAGAALLRKFRQILNPLQVFDLAEGGPEIALKRFRNVPRLRILVCGGDGTVGWVLSKVDEVPMSQAPPIATLPLGTGNDLARSLKWGGGYSKSHSIEDVLYELTNAHVTLLDRWSIDFKPTDAGSGDTASAAGAKSDVMNNYFGIGVDAHIAHGFHLDRQSYPQWYKSQLVNRVWGYGLGGATQMFERSCRNLEQQISIVADGVPITLPKDIEGIIFLNIESYGGGLDLWGSDVEEKYTPVSTHDKKLEVIAVHGSWTMGRMQLGLQSSAVRLCQCNKAVLTTTAMPGREKIPMQVDGEPWQQPACTITVTHKNQAFMLSRATEEGDRTSAIVSGVLDWAEVRNVIDGNTKAVLLKEIAQRIADDHRRRDFVDYTSPGAGIGVVARY